MRKHHRLRLFAFVFLSLVILSFHLTARSQEKPLPSRPVSVRGPLLPGEQAAIAMFEEVKSSVVYITTLVTRRDLMTFKVFEIPQGTGSGFIWDEQGHVVTNFHVIYEAQNVRVTLSDQSQWKANLVGGAVDKDLAVLKIDAPREKLRPIRLGSSADLYKILKTRQIGDEVRVEVLRAGRRRTVAVKLQAI